MKLIALMQVRNEAHMLPYTLPPLTRLCDHIIIADQHSTDDTRVPSSKNATKPSSLTTMNRHRHKEILIPHANLYWMRRAILMVTICCWQLMPMKSPRHHCLPM